MYDFRTDSIFSWRCIRDITYMTCSDMWMHADGSKRFSDRVRGRSGEDRSGEDHSGEDHSGEEHSGEDHSGEDHSGQDKPRPEILLFSLLLRTQGSMPQGSMTIQAPHNSPSAY